MFSEIFTHLHPIVVHFPIAMIIIAVLYDLFLAVKHKSIQASKGIWLWLIAAFGTLVAVATGPEGDARGNTNLFELHQNLADLTAWITVILVAWRLWFILKNNRKFMGILLASYLILAIISGSLVLATGYYGGKMVYDQGVGVKVNGKYVNPPVKGFHGDN